MRNPLQKRIKRELLSEFGKYLAIFLFMTATIGFVSGFLVASRNLQIEYDNAFEKYKMEDGHFVLSKEADQKLIQKVEKEGVTITKDYYQELEADNDGDGTMDADLRVYKNRTQLDLVCLLEGTMPQKEDEIGLDRLYMTNNGLSMGDTVTVGGKKLRIAAMVALPDYSTMYWNNNDLMFDSSQTGIAIVTDECFDRFNDDHLKYNYEWTYEKAPSDDKDEKTKSDHLSEVIYKEAMKQDADLDVFLPQYLNRSIQFAGEDMGGDRPMMTVLLYVLTAIMGFVFAVTIRHTVDKEAAVIGTFRAMGYKKWELFVHYIQTPMLVTLLAAIVGNVLGYTVFEGVAADMYRGSYSLTTYVSYFNAEAFVMTTVVPMTLMFVITSLALWNKLQHSSLEFLRRDLSGKKKQKNIRLPNFKFFTRFRLRVILQNMSGYITLFAGTVFSCLILMFGLLMGPLLNGYSEDAIRYKPAEYQYILQSEKSVPEDVAEPYCVTSLKMQDDFYDEEDINIYGIEEDSKYYPDLKVTDDEIFVTSDFAKKYRVSKGDYINLKEEYGDRTYGFRIDGVYEYPTCLGIFMTRKHWNDVFSQMIEDEQGISATIENMLNSISGGVGDLYYNGYFSDTDLRGTYLTDKQIASVITEADLTKLSRQMDISMGAMFDMVKYFAIILFALLLYLLTKLIIEKNTTSISMVKILGYYNGEISNLFLVSSIWVVILSAVLSLVINTALFHVILRIFLKGYGGWFNLTISPWLYLEMMVMMVGTYVVVALLQFRKIKKIPMSEALKNVE